MLLWADMHLEKGEEMYQNVSGWLLQKLNPQSLSMQLFVIRQVSFVICSKALYFFMLSILHCLQIWAEQESVSNIYLSKEQPHAPTPSYLCSLLQICISSWSLHLVIEWCLVVPSQRGTKSNSRILSLTVLQWWNDLPNPIWIPDNIQETAQFTQLALKQQANNQRMLTFFVSWKSMFVKWRSKDTEWGFGGESCLLLTSVGQMRMWEVRSDLNDASQWGHTDKHNQGSCVL